MDVSLYFARRHPFYFGSNPTIIELIYILQSLEIILQTIYKLTLNHNIFRFSKQQRMIPLFNYHNSFLFELRFK